ncbi:hypothetical protein, partial [Massilia polaris]|uniref:hypothetical protein n=1 Tax=Massilia polaris TaxID=2728846 RepID=UPI0019806190
GDQIVAGGAGQILLDDSELKLFGVLRHEKPQKLVSNFWGSVQFDRRFLALLLTLCGDGA